MVSYLKMKKMIMLALFLVIMSLCSCGSNKETNKTDNNEKKDDGIELTIDNYEKYLDVDCSLYLSDGIDYGEAMGTDRRIGRAVYKSIGADLEVNGKSTNYDYNDIVVKVEIAGDYYSYSEDEMTTFIQTGEPTESQTCSFSLSAETDIVGHGYDSYTFIIPNNKWVLNGGTIGYEITEVSGTLTPVK